MNETSAERLRVDKWLWAARFFKTRGLAAKAVSGGHVHVNGERVKPARQLRVGDMLEITRGHYVWQVTVLGLTARRGPASEAILLYEESEASKTRREEDRERRRLAGEARRQARRPDKRARRQIVRVTKGR